MDKINKNKKAQFYIFAALILVGVLLTIDISKDRSNYKPMENNLYNNFKNEIPFVLDKGAMSNLSYYVDSFLSDFSDYSRSFNVRLEYVYGIVDNGNINIKTDIKNVSFYYKYGNMSNINSDVSNIIYLNDSDFFGFIIPLNNEKYDYRFNPSSRFVIVSFFITGKNIKVYKNEFY